MNGGRTVSESQQAPTGNFYHEILSLGGVTLTTGRPLKLNDLSDVIAWIQNHDATISAWWEEQRRINVAVNDGTRICQGFMQSEIKEMRRDIQGLRKTVYIAMGGAMVVGTILGALLPVLLAHISV